MSRFTTICVAASLSAALFAESASAQSPPDPLAPGAGAEAARETAPAKEEAAPAKAKTAQAAPEDKPHRRAKPEKRTERAPAALSVTVHNDRSVGLVEMTLGPAGGGEQTKAVGPLAFGRKTVIHVRRSADCLYDIHAHFADDADTEQSSVDLCKDKAINLTD